MTTETLLSLAQDRNRGKIRGIPSVCSAHPTVIATALAMGRDRGVPVLIEATCNQVNQDGGYTGMTPADFRDYVLGIAREVGFDPLGLILGGDHLGPNPWTGLPAAQAMERASAMVAAYAAAGFAKIHLDASMACADDPVPVPDAVIAERSARLAAVAEAHAPRPTVYVIGTEVPIPGGALEAVEGLTVTAASAALATAELHRAAFAAAGVPGVYDRVVGLVVQPGVEFGNQNVVAYDPAAAQGLVAALPDLPCLFEAHSTDYQTPTALAALVRDGFGILKVGPGLTFALREALYGLDLIAAELTPGRGASLAATMDRLMLDKPGHWARYYHGTPAEQRLQRHFSYSDRIRYYWTDPVAQAAVAGLLADLGPAPLPEPLISQYLGAAYPQVMSGRVAPSAPALLQASVARALAPYFAACFG